MNVPAFSARVPLPEVPSYVPTPSSARPVLSVELRHATAEKPVAFRHSLEQSYAAGIGGPHRRRPAQSFAASYAAVPASIPLPTGEDDSVEVQLKPMPRNVESVADDPRLHNPLARLERLGTGWFGVSLSATMPVLLCNSYPPSHKILSQGLCLNADRQAGQYDQQYFWVRFWLLNNSIVASLSLGLFGISAGCC